MNRYIASALSLAATTAAIACVAAIALGNAYAETPTIDNAPFVSMRSALTSEDSGSSYFARQQVHRNAGTTMASTAEDR